MEGQRSALMTQSSPSWSEQKDFNVFLRHSHHRPDANLLTPSYLEVRNILYPDEGTFCRVLKYKLAVSFHYRGPASCYLNCDIEISLVVR
jgi:hypothetical protein